MTLFRLKDFDPNYRETFGGEDIKNMDVYSAGTDHKIGSVNDVLVDQEGRFRYLVMDLGQWVFGKKVLLPMGRSRVDQDSRRFYANLNQEEAENLPEFDDHMVADHAHEERVRSVYRRSPAPRVGPEEALEDSAPLEASRPLDAEATSRPPVQRQPVRTERVEHREVHPAPPPTPVEPPGQRVDYQREHVEPEVRVEYEDQPHAYPTPQRSSETITGVSGTGVSGSGVSGERLTQPDTLGREERLETDTVSPYNYDQDPSLYGLNERDHLILKLYEERLMANRRRRPSS